MKPTYDQLEADCAALREALKQVREEWIKGGAATEGMKTACNRIDQLTAHPSSSLLRELEAARKVVEAIKKVPYFNEDPAYAHELRPAITAYDAAKDEK